MWQVDSFGFRLVRVGLSQQFAGLFIFAVQAGLGKPLLNEVLYVELFVLWLTYNRWIIGVFAFSWDFIANGLALLGLALSFGQNAS